MLGPFYVGQKPLEPLTVRVLNYRSEPVDLSDYTEADVRITNPRGEAVDTTVGFVTVTDPTGGVVQFAWPAVSIFTVPGDYIVQLVLTAPLGVKDFTLTETFEVKRPLEGN